MNYLITESWAGRRHVLIKVLRQTKCYATVELLQPALIPHKGQMPKGATIRVRNENIRGRA